MSTNHLSTSLKLHKLYKAAHSLDSAMVFKFVIKVVLTSTAVYWTNQLEVWSTLSGKGRAYDQYISCAKKMIAQNTPDALKLKVQKIQDDKLLLCATTNHYYNRGVINTFEGLLNLPKTIGGFYDKAVEQLNAAQTKPAQ